MASASYRKDVIRAYKGTATRRPATWTEVPDGAVTRVTTDCVYCGMDSSARRFGPEHTEIQMSCSNGHRQTLYIEHGDKISI